MQSTSIRIRSKTRDSLLLLKKHPRESFDEVISRLIDTAVDDEPLGEETLQAIEKSLKEYREGKYFTHEEILAELGVSDDSAEENQVKTGKKKDI